MAGKIFTFIVCAIGVLFLFLMLREITARDPQPWVAVASSGAPAPSTTAGIPEPTTQLSPAVSAFFAHGVGNVPMAGMLLAALGLTAFHRRRARAQRAFDPKAPLRDGPAVIFGEVESLPGHEGPVVEIRIEQHGTQQANKSGWSYTWTEIDREVRASPFVVRCHDGARVRVEPDDQCVIEGSLAEIVRDGPTGRTRRAVLTAGQQVHITGELRGASAHHAREDVYRGASGGPVLGAPRFNRLVISTEAPGDTEALRARFHGRWAVALAICFAVLAGALMPWYEMLAFDGKVVMAEVVGKRTWQEWFKGKGSPGRMVSYYSVRARMPGADAVDSYLEQNCDEELYRCVDRGECAHVPFVVSTHLPAVYELGTHATLETPRTVGVTLLMLILGLAYPLSTIESRPWYMKKKLVESGTGRLADSKP